MPSNHKVALFHSARAVIKADAACQKAGLPTKVLPVPERLSSECGMCLAVSEAIEADFLQLMQEKQIEVTLYDDLSQ
jgi:hypothetical protein